MREFAGAGPSMSPCPTLNALEALGRAARAQHAPGSSPSPARSARPAPRKRCAACCRRRRDACVGGLLQQSLGRAADAGAHAARRALRRVRDRHESRRRDRAAGRHWSGRMSRSSRRSRRSISNISRALDAIADAKAEIFSGLEPRAASRSCNRDDRAIRAAASTPPTRRPRASSRRFGASERRRRAALDHPARASDATTRVSARCAPASRSTTGSARRARHVALNSLAVLLAARRSGSTSTRRRDALADFAPPEGRGERETRLRSADGAFTLIDESYNANPASMRAALDLLGARP